MFHRSERLFLRPGFPEDWEEIYAQVASRELARMLASAPWPYTADHAQAFAARAQDGWTPHFLVTLPGEGIVGSAGLEYDDATDEVQLGYWIGAAYQGRGFASEAARAVLCMARTIGHDRIVASHFLDNPGSGRVLAKAGFRPTGEVRPGYSLARGGYDPVACYEISLRGYSGAAPDPVGGHRALEEAA